MLTAMPSQLRLVDENGPGTPVRILATFRADARLRLWGTAACALATLAFTALGYRRTVAPVMAGPLAASFLLWSAYLLVTFAGRRATRYSLTGQRLEIEQGILGKRVDSLELWRVRDLVLEQTFLERLRGVGRITVYSTDEVEPVLQVGPATGARALFDRFRDAVSAARREARVIALDQGRG